MKFKCKVCLESCLLDMGDSSVIPEECPIGIDAVDWREVTEPAALPKLTVEALAERGIEWPEWAVCAGVHAFGRLMFFEKRPRLNTSIGGWDYYGFDPIPKMSDTNDFFDYSDWQNSLIMRSDKVEKPDENRFVLDGVEYEAVAAKSGIYSENCGRCDLQKKCHFPDRPSCVAKKRRDKRNVFFRKVEQLPDWLKVGAWAAVGKFVGKIDWINRDASECRITCGESRFAKRDEVKAVTWRAWTFEEAPEAVKCNIGGVNRIGRITMLEDKGNPIYGYELPGVTCFASFSWMLNNATQLNGLPCGVPQVDGKDLEG